MQKHWPTAVDWDRAKKRMSKCESEASGRCHSAQHTYKII